MALQAKIGQIDFLTFSSRVNQHDETKRKNGSSSIRTRSLTRKVIDNDDDGDDTNFITLTRNIHFG